MLAIEGVEDVRGVRVSSLIEMLAILSIQNVRGIGVSSFVKMFAIPCGGDVRRIVVASRMDVNVCHSMVLFKEFLFPTAKVVVFRENIALFLEKTKKDI